MRQAGDALFDRQGFRRDAAPGAQGFFSGAPALPAAARRHALEVPRDDRVPRPHGEDAGLRAARPHQSRRRRPGHRPLHPRLGTAHPDHEDRGAEAGARQIRLRRRLRRRPARRGEIARQGTHLLLPRRAPPLGPQEPASGAVEPLQHAHQQGRVRSASSRCPTGPSSTSGNTSISRGSRSSRSISPTSGRW